MEQNKSASQSEIEEPPERSDGEVIFKRGLLKLMDYLPRDKETRRILREAYCLYSTGKRIKLNQKQKQRDYLGFHRQTFSAFFKGLASLRYCTHNGEVKYVNRAFEDFFDLYYALTHRIPIEE